MTEWLTHRPVTARIGHMATTRTRSHLSTVYAVGDHGSVQVHRGFRGFDIVSYQAGDSRWVRHGNRGTRSEADTWGAQIADLLTEAERALETPA